MIKSKTKIVYYLLGFALVFLLIYFKWQKSLTVEIPKIKNFELFDENNKCFYINEIVIKESPILVFRFSEYNCDICVSTELELHKKIMHKIENINLIYISTYQNDRYFSILKNKNKFIYPIFRTNQNIINQKAEELNVPYYFLVDKSFSVSEVFIPDKSKPEITEKFIDNIKMKYFLNSK